MKAEKRDNCYGCQNCIYGEILCLKDHHRAATEALLFSACPLPDWPRVGQTWIDAFQLIHDPRGDWLDTLKHIGVDAEEEKS